ncbi:MAG TPA: histidine phosphatase family protein [Hyphomicrobiales bacterium]|nr:histidine phosphatase family protein [Hyphomicrobiales bacterium]
MTKIILVRHGHVEGISPPRFRGREDLPLTARGKWEAERTGQRIRASWAPIAVVLSSPMSRAADTAKAIATAGLALEVKLDPNFNDIDYGKWLGRSREEASASWPEEVDRWYRVPHLVRIPGGESLQDVLARIAQGLREIVRQYPDQIVAIAGHDSVNRVLLLHALELPLSRYWSLKQDPCAINELDFSGDGFVVRTMNDTGHLCAN